MNEEKDKGIDDLFKKKLEDPVVHVSYREDDWGALEEMLGKRQKKKGMIYLLPILGSVAALLLLFLGWWAFRPHESHNNKPGQAPLAVNQPKKAGAVINSGTKQQPAQHVTPLPEAPPANFIASAARSKKGGSKLVKSPAAAAHGRNVRAETAPGMVAYNNPGETLQIQRPAAIFQPEQITATPVNIAGLYSANGSARASAVQPPKKGSPRLTKGQNPYRPQFALSVLAAPDINGVGSFQQSKVGTNVGMQLSVGVSSRFTITTGAIYSAKPYNVGFVNYHTPYQFPVTPANITADCRMIDVPLNIGYQVYSRQQNKISLGTGLSSYLMLHESYKFNYSSSYATGPSNYTVPHSGKYFFGVLNLNATYQHMINQKVGFTVQPYLKLPLTDLGYSQVRLQTTGVAVGISWNLNSLTKP